MSDAFETVDHRTLLHRLHAERGIGGTAMDWFESYLVDRQQVVSIGDQLKTTTRWGARAFSKAVPVLWNNLPSTITTAASLASFKTGL